MIEHIEYTSKVANDWKQAIADVSKDYPYLFKRVLDCSTSSQLQSKLWAVNQLKKIVGILYYVLEVLFFWVDGMLILVQSY